ncbi:Ligand-binding SRPBCC domain-containing protein [Granulicella pectinivorans]|jgi:ligand-binding SRPBCC domain-containing protein|uniref:Ligand-binding SRPBCC domain-containing protein n=1 Tax=Granulicella pectinivorans TaxID=474950 RepID=A0A1I6M6T8_9BACT|nr:SRPBCC family protein [Granulicella pectinivorans]SFS11212.1 Ligand-binding SRPBCC domain-containing protein [Granulicella pectinivorans]
MMTYTYNAEQWLPFPIEVVFAFFSNPENLPRLMPGWQKARIEEASFAPPPPHPTPSKRIRGIAAGAGTRITMSFRPFPLSPIRLPWEAEITEFEWNDHFCDIQVRGPFAYWKHCHRLTVEGAGTRLKDSVEYELPLGALSPLAQPFAAFQIASIFKFRQARTAELLPLMVGSLR